MDYSTHMLVLAFLFSCLWTVIFFHRNQNPKFSKLPPGPPPFPIIGNILKIGKNPHQSLSKLSKIYGSLMTIKLGSITTIVISSPEIAKEALHKHDLAFSGRTVPYTLQTLDHHKFSVVFLDPSRQWKTLRRACVTKIFSSSQLDSTQNLRLSKLQEMLEYVNECCRKSSEALDIGELAFTTVLNSISSTLFSIDLAGFASNSSREFRDLIWGMMEEAGKPNIADFFPVLRVIDPQGARSRMNNYSGQLLKLLDDIVGERMDLIRASEMESDVCSDVLGSLLGQEEQDKLQLGRLDIVHLFGDLLVAGTDTTSSTVEWAMAELLRNPEKLEKLRKELQQVIGYEDNKDIKIEESHVSKLPFLRAVIKETLRLHPPAPLLVPHKALEDAEIRGFTVPKNAQILINVWAMGRDSSIWHNPNQFMPERFLESEVDFKSHDFKLVPFGAGRRMCPGLPLAFRLAHLILASLTHKYNWKLAGDLHPDDIDMEEKFGLTLKRVQPLRVIPTKV